jgi:hypothetical protein
MLPFSADWRVESRWSASFRPTGPTASAALRAATAIAQAMLAGGD